MHEKSESDLRQLARDCIAEKEDIQDAWVIFRDGAHARYNAEDDGSLADYGAEVKNIFNAETLAAYNDEQVAEAMGIYTRTYDDERFIPQAEQSLRSFEASEGHPATDYLEIEEWSKRHLHSSGKFIVLEGGMQVPSLPKK